MKPVADIVLLGGKIVTWSEEEPTAEAVAMARGVIIAVGSRSDVEDFVGSGTRRVNLEGRLVLPGFTDAHSHLASEGRRLSHLDLSTARSLRNFKENIRRAAESLGSGEWVLGKKWDESRWPTPNYPTLGDLDEAAPRNPVALVRVDGHLTIVNSEALKRLSSEVATASERDSRSEPTGIYREEAADRLWVDVGRGTDITGGIARMVKLAHRLGVTSIHDVVDAAEAAAYSRLNSQGRLKLRVNLMPLAPALPTLMEGGLRSSFGSHTLRIGPIKAFLDGSLGARTAALAEDYSDEGGNRGASMPPEELLSLVQMAAKGGFQLALHAIGDEAIDLGLEALAGVDSKGMMHRIEHFELPRAEHLKLGKRLGIVASMQPNFVGQWSLPGGMYERRLGAKRLKGNNPFRLVLDEGLTLIFGSDHMPFSPLYGLHWAVNAPFDDQRLTVEEALRCYTQTAAGPSFEESSKGTIEPGKLADLVVLEQDPFKAPDRLKDMQVHMTIFDGEIVYVSA